MAKANKKTILVSGATGNQGGAVLRHLRAKGFQVRAITRDMNSAKARALMGPGVELAQADLDDAASLARALEGVAGVYSVQGFAADMETEVRQGKNLVDAANRAGVGHFVYSSVVAADRNTGIPHFESKFRIEEHLRGKGMKYTILRPVAFMDNFLGMRSSIEQGTLALPLSPQTRWQLIAVDDIGAFAAIAFEKPGHWQGRTMELAGDEPSITEIAEALSRASGRQVKYQQAPWDQFEKQMGPDLTKMFRWFEEGNHRVDIAAVKAEYPALMNLERWLNTHWQTAVGKGA